MMVQTRINKEEITLLREQYKKIFSDMKEDEAGMAVNSLLHISENINSATTQQLEYIDENTEHLFEKNFLVMITIFLNLKYLLSRKEFILNPKYKRDFIIHIEKIIKEMVNEI